MLTPQNAEALAALVKQISPDQLRPKQMPFKAWEALKSVTVSPAIELALTNEQKQLLLVPRYDEHWSGYHLPGGYMAVGESFHDAIKRLAMEELGINVIDPRLVASHVWEPGKHPYAYPVSHTVILRSVDMPNKGEWFGEVPENMVQYHGLYASAAYAVINGHVTVEELSSIMMGVNPSEAFFSILNQRKSVLR